MEFNEHEAKIGALICDDILNTVTTVGLALFKKQNLSEHELNLKMFHYVKSCLVNALGNFVRSATNSFDKMSFEKHINLIIEEIKIWKKTADEIIKQNEKGTH
jgi:hypothetical protein